MLLNIQQLLAEQGAGFRHLVSAITYLKRAEDLPAMLEVCHRRGFPENIPNTFCVADVCRPEWLCEMEAIAVMT
jgi:enamine deaminase RidA (YjgF/YER057c/UK114 family)